MRSDAIIKVIRYLLFPVSVIYGLVVLLRNFLYNKKILRSATFNVPLICVGNLSVGGTGKTPMTEYLIRLLKKDYRVATLSRGYKRKTKGYLLAGKNSTARDIGDEPMQFYTSFPEIRVAVGEQRAEAIPALLDDAPETEIIILDDAFQHRPVNAGLNILLTEFGNLYVDDFFLPAGNLRDAKTSAQRAHIIIVTKCQPDLSLRQKENITGRLNPLPGQQVFFSHIAYNAPYHLFARDEKKKLSGSHVLLITGIANTGKLISYIQAHAGHVELLRYSDHHDFNYNDMLDLSNRFSSVAATDKIILTTEKDAVKLSNFKDILMGLPVYVLPIQHAFLFDEQSKFDATILNFVKKFSAKEVN